MPSLARAAFFFPACRQLQDWLQLARYVWPTKLAEHRLYLVNLIASGQGGVVLGVTLALLSIIRAEPTHSPLARGGRTTQYGGLPKQKRDYGSRTLDSSRLLYLSNAAMFEN
ncbi:hypothetical protein BO94DRAFT_548496 [Aspergillus sclerotioniger CBS 115572]|uniref:Uncharacterized protein n=1 Tax=Aspergillus sclerotioniger CBS 115572 TaxID=1450535 RepID=A0A317W0G1_9EURO|nr:hypothetical protein BO94DRAFT_548496 [Aspergillus sclerotioniger CBS 115572]PWY79389.1 hypothetical protein BO94DRAFT_548496 [Aspergillus sclerotioniger CBS 115572]